VVVAVGLTLVEPVADVEVKVPGEMETVVALLVAQFRVLVAPEFTLVGLAAKDEIEGMDEAGGAFREDVVALPQPDKAAQTAESSKMRAPASDGLELSRFPNLLMQKRLKEYTRRPSVCQVFLV
jgi:hypothetical protein